MTNAIKKISGVAIENIKKLNGLRPDDGYTKLLIHLDGADGATSYTAETGQTVTFSGQAQLDTTQKKFGGSSLFCDGSSDYISVPSHTDFAFGTGAFTVEFFFRLTALNILHILYSHGGSNSLEVTGGVLFVNTTDIGYYCSGTRISGSNSILSANQWYHLAFVGNGGANGSRNIKLYINGTQIGSTFTYDYNFSQESPWFGANEDSSGECLSGWIDEIRISKGIARWTSNFTPPDSEYRQIKKFMGVSNV